MRLDVRWTALALCLPLVAARAGTATDYAYAFALDTTAPAEAYRVVLSPAVIASANPAAGQRDLVVVNASGRPVPFAPLPSTAPEAHRFLRTAQLLAVPPTTAPGDGVQVSRNADGGIVIRPQAMGAAVAQPRQWLVDAGRSIRLESIALDPASLRQDFQIRLALDVSDDLRRWNTLVEDTPLVRIHSPLNQVEQLGIATPVDTTGRYYRLRLLEGEPDWSGPQLPSVRLEGDYRDPAADRASQLQWLPATSSGDGSDVEYTLPAALPVEAVKVQLPAANTAARVHLQWPVGEGGSNWVDVATIDLVRAAGQGGDATVHVSPRAVLHLRLHSETPLVEAPALSIGWVPPQYVFLPEGSAPFRLLTGSYAARRGDYPVEQALDRLRSKNGDDWLPPVATLGARVDEAGAAALQAPRVPYDWTRLLLWGVLVVGALMVAGMALSLLRRGRRDEPGS